MNEVNVVFGSLRIVNLLTKIVFEPTHASASNTSLAVYTWGRLIIHLAVRCQYQPAPTKKPNGKWAIIDGSMLTHFWWRPLDEVEKGFSNLRQQKAWCGTLEQGGTGGTRTLPQ